MGQLDIPSLAVGQRIQDTFLVLDVETRSLDSGDAFTVLRLGNSTGAVPTEPFWPSRADEIAGLGRGHPVQVIGEIQLYRQRRQVRVSSIRALPRDSVDLKALLPSAGPVERYWERIDSWRREMSRPRLRRVVDLFYEDEIFRRQYEECPASIRGHHAQLGGLLKHTTEVAVIGRAAARTCGADMDLVLAGVLLHDIGKLQSYRWDQGAFEYTLPGTLVGHVTLGALMFSHRLAEESDPPCLPHERDVLLHIILSHHGRLEFGSPVQPAILEAEVLHWADNTSAKTTDFSDALRDPTNFQDGPVSSPQWSLDRRRVYRFEGDWGTND